MSYSIEINKKVFGRVKSSQNAILYNENYYVIPIIISFIHFIVHALSERQRILKIKKRCLHDHHDF